MQDGLHAFFILRLKLLNSSISTIGKITIRERGIKELDETIMNTDENLQQDDVLKVIEQAADNLDEEEEGIHGKWHERTTETTTIRALLKRQKEGRIQLPLCQRLYVWDANKRAELLKSIEKNYSCGTIIIAENNKAQYLVDGLQRLTSCMYLSIDYDRIGMTAEQKKAVLDYNITLSIVKDMDEKEIKEYFNCLNSGVALAAVVKERSKLSNRLNHAILSVASHGLFREAETTSTFNKGHHHELIAMNALLAVCGVEQGENKAKALCRAIVENEEEAIEKAEQAKALVGRVAKIYEGIEEDIVKRSLNANFVGTLVYVLARKNYPDDQVKALIKHIFAKKRAVPDYTATTSQGAAGTGRRKERYNLLIRVLEGMQAVPDDMEGFEKWALKQEDIEDTGKKYSVAFHCFPSEEQKALFMAHAEGKASAWNAVVKRRYEALEQAKEV